MHRVREGTEGIATELTRRWLGPKAVLITSAGSRHALGRVGPQRTFYIANIQTPCSLSTPTHDSCPLHKVYNISNTNNNHEIPIMSHDMISFIINRPSQKKNNILNIFTSFISKPSPYNPHLSSRLLPRPRADSGDYCCFASRPSRKAAMRGAAEDLSACCGVVLPKPSRRAARALWSSTSDRVCSLVAHVRLRAKGTLPAAPKAAARSRIEAGAMSRFFLGLWARRRSSWSKLDPKTTP